LFFQAEDGIRDDLVTGVQTCALPISADIGAEQGEAVNGVTTERSNKRKGLAGLGGLGAALSALLLKFPLLAPLLKFGWLGFSARSEERRVGKECSFG